ncbi:MAG: lysylphosphatidylglycerol synthase transmembrane domain-containing protein [Tistlia sp.]|uniref:YbhN family protein n=1 Tax=Tistlia sp. TaxID=3057121 RepID=UPI0034A10DCF
MTVAAAGPLDRRRLWRIGLGFAVFLLAFGAAAAVLDPAALAERLGSLSAGLVAALLALSLVNYAVRLLRWRLFAGPLGAQAPLGEDVLTYMASFALTATPGKAGELLRVWLLKRRCGLSYARTLPVFLADRLCDLLALSVLSLGALGWVVGGALALPVAVGLGGGLLLLFLRPAPLIALVGALYGRLRRWPRGFAQARRALRQGERLRRPGLWLAGVGLGLVGWGCEGAGLWLVLQALGSPLALPEAVAVFALSLVVGVASLLPGGLGGTEAGMVGLLLLRGVPAATALAATLTVRLATLWFAVALGLCFLPFALRRRRSA